jgi:predicted metalloprotease with PDZ domain
VVVLLPLLESGAESYRGSFALSTDKPPDQSTHPAWANLVAHEIFHVWNGWLLRGADYASTQWFQEGFTEYAANAAIVTSGLAGEDWLRAKLAEHVRNSRRLATTLENTGGRKGPPLYSAGALVAFTWDVRIRAASGGRSDLGAFFRELMRRTDGGKGAYAWPDLRAALDATAVGDWEAFYQAYIRGSERLPIQQALASVGQRLVESAEGQVRIEANPGAPPDAQRLWTDLLRGK